MAAVTAEAIPTNLPTGNPVIGYEALLQSQETDESAELTVLENQAHIEKVLLSSDAMRFFIAKVASKEDRTEALARVLARGRVSFPSEDGWVVINLARMEELLDEVNKHTDAHVANEFVVVGDTIPTIAMTAGSLAEAVVTNNVTAAYEMISHRPMIALADAAADLDAVYRLRNGEQASVSDLLQKEASKLSDVQLKEVITALTSALDGTYTDEESAVKMAIMKAVAVVGQHI